jgi:hypothetical protein
VRCIAVDWSGDARASAQRRKIVLAECGPAGLERVEDGRTRDELVRHLIEHLIEIAREDPELAVGFDFSFGLPAWFVERHGCATAPELWRVVAERGEDWLSECPPPFWGRRGTRRPAPDATKPLFRATESRRVAAHGVQPKSSFQIAGAGAEGRGSDEAVGRLPEGTVIRSLRAWNSPQRSFGVRLGLNPTTKRSCEWE